MVDISPFAEVALTIAMLILSLIVGGGAVTGLFLGIQWWKRYSQFICVIWEKDGFGQLKQTKDRAGIFVDNKTKNKRLFLQRNKVGLNPDSIPYISGKKKDTIYLYKTGLKNFHFIDVKINEPKITLTVGEEDVNWSINAYERQKKIFSTSLLMQLMPYILLAFVSIIILVIFMYFFKNFGTLNTMATSMTEAAKVMKDLAMLQRNGTVVLS